MNRKEFLTKAIALLFGAIASPQLLANENKKTIEKLDLVPDINGIIDLPIYNRL